jgi:hypothetical protein
MKKSLFIALAFLLCTAVTIQAQPKFGLRAGVNINKASMNADMFKTSNMTGFQVGPTMEFTVPLIGIGMDASILYSQQGLKLKSTTGIEGGNIKQHSIDVPINLKYKFSLVVIGAYLTAGPYLRFNVSDSVSDTWKEFKDEWETKSFGAGLNFGAGIELLSHLQVGISYQLGLTDDFKASIPESATDVKDIKAKSRGWIISAAYYF